jgi:hypothetical protein
VGGLHQPAGKRFQYAARLFARGMGVLQRLPGAAVPHQFLPLANRNLPGVRERGKRAPQVVPA